MNKAQQSLLSYSYDLLARRRYTIKEMIKKLDTANQKRLPPLPDQELQEVIESLLRSNFLNDLDYASSYIDSKTRQKPIGLYKIKQQLELKGISSDLIHQALSISDFDESAAVKVAMEKKLKLMRVSWPLDQNHKQKLFRFLQSRGFRTDQIFPALQDPHDF